MYYIRLQFVWNLILTAYVLIVTGVSAAEPDAYRHWLTLPLDYDPQAKRSPYNVEGPLGVAFSPDGKTLAAAFHEMGVVLFDLPTGKVTATFRQPDEKAYGVAFSPDGKLMAVSGLGAWLWDVTKGQPKPLGKHPLWVFSVAFSPDGRTLAVGTSREPFHLWDLATGKSIAEFDIYAGTGPNLDTGLYKPHVSSFAFSPDGKTLAAHIYFYEDELPIFDHMQIWDLELRTLRASFRGTCGLFTPDGESFIYGLNGKIMLRNAKALDEVVTIEGETKIDPTSLSVMALSRDGKTLAANSEDHAVEIWNLPARKLIAVLKVHKRGIRSIALSAGLTGRKRPVFVSTLHRKATRQKWVIKLDEKVWSKRSTSS